MLSVICKSDFESDEVYTKELFDQIIKGNTYGKYKIKHLKGEINFNTFYEKEHNKL